MRISDVISQSPDVMHGAVVFSGTRVPAQSLIEHLKAGDSIEEFLDGFPSVRREQAEAFLEFAFKSVVNEVEHARTA